MSEAQTHLSNHKTAVKYVPSGTSKYNLQKILAECRWPNRALVTQNNTSTNVNDTIHKVSFGIKIIKISNSKFRHRWQILNYWFYQNSFFNWGVAFSIIFSYLLFCWGCFFRGNLSPWLSLRVGDFGLRGENLS